MTGSSPWVRHPPGEGQSSGVFEVPTHWMPAQATAVFEVLDELRELVWRRYGVQIQKVQRRNRVVKTSAIPANLRDGDVPF